jgi:hypothetical protein
MSQLAPLSALLVDDEPCSLDTVRPINWPGNVCELQIKIRHAFAMKLSRLARV